MRELIWSFAFTLLWTFSQSANSCVTPNGLQSQCISLYDCADLLNAFKLRPLPTNVITFLRQSQCGFDENIPRVCCGPLPPNKVDDKVITSIHTTQRPAPERQVPASDEDATPAAQGQCGADLDGDRIYGGILTDIDEFPWMALLGYRKKTGSLTYLCGGVLINKRYVLTAAHCITGAIQSVGTLEQARLGEYNTQTDIDCIDRICNEPTQDITVQSALAHPGFSDSNRNRHDDIGIVRLASRARYSDYVQPVCLVAANTRLATDTAMFVAGWGKTELGSNSPIKLKLKLNVFDPAKCKEKYRTLSVSLSDGQLCAGGVHTEDACRGDSGGPLMRKVGGSWEIVGIVSFGYGCGKEGWPGVYTNVASYDSWIRNKMQEMNV